MALKCNRCGNNQGIIEVDDGYKYFHCLRCGEKYFMKFYRSKIKEWEENNIEVEEIKF